MPSGDERLQRTQTQISSHIKQRLAYEQIIGSALLQVIDNRNKRKVEEYTNAVETLEIICSLPRLGFREKLQSYRDGPMEKQKQRYKSRDWSQKKIDKRLHDSLLKYIVRLLDEAGLAFSTKDVRTGGTLG